MAMKYQETPTEPSFKTEKEKITTYIKRRLLPGASQNSRIRIEIVAVSALAYWLQKSAAGADLDEIIEREITNPGVQDYAKDVAHQYRALIEDVSERFSAAGLYGVAADSVQDNSDYDGDGNHHKTPECVTNLAIGLLDIQHQDIVLDVCSGENMFLVKAAKERLPQKLYGVEWDDMTVALAEIRNKILELPIQNNHENVLTADLLPYGANKVFCHGPAMHGMARVKEMLRGIDTPVGQFFKDAKLVVNGTWVFVLAAIFGCRPGGKVVAIVPNNCCWNDADADIRRYLVDKGYVEAVINLPPKLFFDTAISFSVMVFSEGNTSVRMIDASALYTAGRRMNTMSDEHIQRILTACADTRDICVVKDIESLASDGYELMPMRYVNAPRVEWGNAVQLGDVCEVYRGAPLTKRQLDELICDEPTNCHYLMLKDIQDSKMSDEMSYLSHMDPAWERYCLRNGDVLLTKTTPRKIALAKVPEGRKIVANGNVYLLRADSTRILPEYLMLYLQSPKGEQFLNAIAKGGIVQTISVKDLKSVPIPMLPLFKQEQITQEYNELAYQRDVLERKLATVKHKSASILEGISR